MRFGYETQKTSRDDLAIAGHRYKDLLKEQSQ